MSRVWICLNLLWAATYFLQSIASSEEVLVKCPTSEEVEAGHSLTINCSVNYGSLTDCKITTVQLKINNVTQDIPKDESPYIVLLNVSNVTKSNNWTVEVRTTCGLPKRTAIEVKVRDPQREPKKVLTPGNPPKQESKVPTILGVCVPLTIAFVLLLFGIRKFLKHIKRKKNQGDYTLPDSSSLHDEC